MTRKTVQRDSTSISVDVRGEGVGVLMLPSLGRGAADFAQLGTALAAAGFQAVAMDPRGIGESTGPLEDLTVDDLVADAAAVVEGLCSPPAHILGHAFGQRIARHLATDRPELVRSLTLLAAGGIVEPEPDARQGLFRSLDQSLGTSERMESVRYAFFADGNDPSVWQDGWWPEAARAQAGAWGRATPPEDWWLGGSAPMLVVQGLHDRTAPPANGRLLAERAGERVTLLELDGAGHALLPEQPEAIARAVIEFIGAH